jgi:SNF2 family DNA or RNA helicase
MLTKGDAGRKTVQDAMRKLQAVLKAILLRRTKTSLIDGKPIINLPPKSEEIQHVVFSPDEQQFYNALESKTQILFNKYLRANTVGKNYSNVLVLLLRLRQACCHPHLIMDFEDAPPAGVDITVEEMIELAKGLAPDVVGRLLAAEGFEVSSLRALLCLLTKYSSALYVMMVLRTLALSFLAVMTLVWSA